MAFRVKDDFQAGRPMSQVSAAWFNAVGHFINWITGGFGITTKKSNSGKMEISLNRETLRAEIDNAMQGKRISKKAGTPVDKSDSPEALDTQGESWTWTTGGANGLTLDAYYKIGASGSYHLFQRCRLTISRDGLIAKAEGLPDRIRVRA